MRPEDPARPADSLVVAGAARDEAGLDLHTDRAMYPGPRARLLGLLCVRPAASGGESLLVSGHAVHDALLAPDRGRSRRSTRTSTSATARTSPAPTPSSGAGTDVWTCSTTATGSDGVMPSAGSP
ncbi:hypothetical protein GCM10020229_46940 [Kitasatospora albolonga]|uniref:TauD/TfdA family dioxygenase n=1 Tax=Kitasatospora albolonga TaxID=68173 RepID=UPI00337C91F8